MPFLLSTKKSYCTLETAHSDTVFVAAAIYRLYYPNITNMSLPQHKHIGPCLQHGPMCRCVVPYTVRNILSPLWTLITLYIVPVPSQQTKTQTNSGTKQVKLWTL